MRGRSCRLLRVPVPFQLAHLGAVSVHVVPLPSASTPSSSSSSSSYPAPAFVLWSIVYYSALKSGACTYDSKNDVLIRPRGLGHPLPTAGRASREGPTPIPAMARQGHSVRPISVDWDRRAPRFVHAEDCRCARGEFRLGLGGRRACLTDTRILPSLAACDLWNSGISVRRTLSHISCLS